jgi:hypothetical protein
MTPYTVSYSVSYPVIVHVEDKTIDKIFRFAILVSIEDNSPGFCSIDLGPSSGEYAQECVNREQSDVKITVKDSASKPIEGADVSFGSCVIGETNANGVVTGGVPYKLTELKVYKSGYKIYREFLSWEELNKTVTLKKIQEKVKINFYGVPITAGSRAGQGVYQSYSASQPKIINNDNPLRVMGVLNPTDPSEITLYFQNINETDEFANMVNYSGVYPGDFYVSGNVVNNKTQLVTGYFNTTFTINENDKELYVYVPDVEGITENMNSTESSKLTQAVINKCGGLVLRQPC